MNFGVITTEPVLARIPTTRNTSDRITEYGLDNLYPQRMHQVALLSPIAKSAISLVASFIRGDGFERGDVVINEQGETANDILKQLSNDRAEYNGYALHLNSTGIGKVQEVQHIPFEFVRLGLANQRGLIRDVKVSNNWNSSEAYLLPIDEQNETRYLLFDHEQNGREALTTGRGMVLYNTPKKNTYPLCAIDAIVETCQSDHELQNFELGNITNGFLSMSIFKFPSSGDTEDEEEALRKKLNDLKGAANANSIIVASIDEDYEGGSLVEQIPANNNDSLFINTTLNVRQRIIQNFGVPQSLLAVQNQGTLFSAQQIADDYTFMNLRTKDIRNELERQFAKLGLDVGKIVPNQFDSSLMHNTNGNEQGQSIPSESGSNGL